MSREWEQCRSVIRRKSNWIDWWAIFYSWRFPRMFHDKKNRPELWNFPWSFTINKRLVCLGWIDEGFLRDRTYKFLLLPSLRSKSNNVSEIWRKQLKKQNVHRTHQLSLIWAPHRFLFQILDRISDTGKKSYRLTTKLYYKIIYIILECILLVFVLLMNDLTDWSNIYTKYLNCGDGVL